jgi:hypothetical protein
MSHFYRCWNYLFVLVKRHNVSNAVILLGWYVENFRNDLLLLF